jgi:hypothetical protein
MLELSQSSLQIEPLVWQLKQGHLLQIDGGSPLEKKPSLSKSARERIQSKRHERWAIELVRHQSRDFIATLPCTYA